MRATLKINTNLYVIMEFNKEKYEEWRRDPANWILYFFYYNKEDPRLFPRKRLGFGWTINFANPYSILFFIFILVIIIFVLSTNFH
ncbi:MAG: DUF5808 domain-containing protein [Bacteroidota bacterium]